MIRNYLLNSTAMFAAPDAPGADTGGSTDQVADIGGSPEPAGGSPEGGEAPAGGAAPEPAPKEDHSKPRVETISDSVKRAVTETKEKEAAAAKAKTTKAAAKKDSTQAGAETGDLAKPSSEDGSTAQTDPSPKAEDGPPTSWTAAEKQLWTQLPDAAKTAVLRHDQNTSKGVAELRTRYQEIDTAVAPYKAVMTQNNVTPGQAISQLFKWHMELAGPNKIEAFRQLAKSFGVDPATIAAAPATTEKPADANPDNSIPENLRPVITNLETRLKTFEERESAAMQNAAKQTWQNWSKDKPHAETVRGLMANLINSDLALIQAGQPQISNTIKNGSIDMDAAYEAAKYAHKEVREALIQEDQAKRDKEARAAAEKARKAGASLKSGAPAGPISASSNAAPRNETVAESIKRALAEVRGTQH
jgi:hypothetical protein